MYELILRKHDKSGFTHLGKCSEKMRSKICVALFFK
jgi:hypothetical protein